MMNVLSSIKSDPRKRTLLLVSTSAIFALCVLWLAYQFSGAFLPQPVARPPDSPRDLFAAAMQESIKQDPRFIHADVISDPQNETGLLVTGDIGSASDEAALRDRAKELAENYELRFDVYIMKR